VWAEYESRGTAFGVRPNLLVTCAHVVRGKSQIKILSPEQVFDGAFDTTANVLAVDEQRDLAILRVPHSNFPSLRLASNEELDDSTPLLIWTWPGWNEWETKPSARKLERSDLKPTPRAAVISGFWDAKEDRASSFSFAGHVEGGMSGGPVVSALTGEVVGVVKRFWNLDPNEIAETWKLSIESLGIYPDMDGPWPNAEEIVVAQLSLGSGMASPARELQSLLDSL